MSFARQLEEASAEWVTEGIIPEAVRGQLLERHPVVSGRSRVVGILAAMGGLTIAAGILLLVASNWEEIPRATKLAGASAVMAAAFSLGYWVRFGRGLRRTGEAIILVGSGAFLGDLALVSQQYHIMTNPSSLLFAFFASMVPLPYLLRSRMYALLTPAAGVAWLVALMTNEDSRFHVDEGMEAMILLAGAGAGIVSIGAVHRFGSLRALAAPMEIAGGALLFFAVFWLGFYRHDIPESGAGRWGLAVFLGPAALAVAALTAVAMSRIPSWRTRNAVAVAAVLVIGTLAWCLLVGLEPRSEGQVYRDPKGEGDFAFYTGGFWVAYVAVATALAWLAFALRRDWWLNASLVAIGVFLMARYFDLFSETERRGLVFVGAGVVLLVVAAALEHSRRLITTASEVQQ